MVKIGAVDEERRVLVELIGALRHDESVLVDLPIDHLRFAGRAMQRFEAKEKIPARQEPLLPLVAQEKILLLKDTVMAEAKDLLELLVQLLGRDLRSRRKRFILRQVEYGVNLFAGDAFAPAERRENQQQREEDQW